MDTKFIGGPMHGQSVTLAPELNELIVADMDKRLRYILRTFVRVTKIHPREITESKYLVLSTLSDEQAEEKLEEIIRKAA